MRKYRRSVSLMAACILLLVLILPGMTLPVRAASNSLTIKAGYFGLPYAVKGEYSASQVEAIGVHKALYTMNSNGGFLSYADAEGVYLKDLLNHAGVNVGKINYVNFTATDGHNASKNYYYNTLFGTRYAFPALSQYYGQLEGVTDEGIVWESAVQVKTMLAVRDNFARVDDFSEYFPADMSSSHRFRLMIGQEYPGQVVAVDSIYNVNTVIVTYTGSPEIDAESNVTISIDEDHTLVYDISSADSAITQMIKDGLKFESSDPGIVSVDANGKLTAKQPGEVEITIYYESTDIDASNISTTVRVKVGESSGNGGDGTGDGLGDGTGDGNGSQGTDSGDGQGGGSQGNLTDGENGDKQGDGQESGQPTQKPTEPATKPQNDPQDTDNQKPSNGQTSEENDQPQEEVYISQQPQNTTQNHTLRVRRVKTASENPAPSPGMDQIQNGGGEAGSEGGSEALGLRLDNTMLMVAAVLAVVLFLTGGIDMYRKFRKEIQEMKKCNLK